MLKFEISEISFKDKDASKLYEKVNTFLELDKQDNPFYYLDQTFKIKGERLQLLNIVYVKLFYFDIYVAQLTMMTL